MSDAKTNYEAVLKQEQTLQFDAFSRDAAWDIGHLLLENAKKYPDPLAVEITVNGLVVFRFFSEGTVLNSHYWMIAKRNSVELWNMSSLRVRYFFDMTGETFAGHTIDPNNYAKVGGGFPINLRGTGMIGTICVSGLPNHVDDHQLIVDTLTGYLQK